MAEVFGLYTHIRSNRRKSWLLLAGLFLLVYAVAYAIAILMTVGLGSLPLEGRSTMGDAMTILRIALPRFLTALPFVTLGVTLWIIIGYYAHQKMIDWVTGSHGITRAEDPELYGLLETLCISRGLTMPKLKIMESEALNAFASGMNEKQFSVTVTRGLRDTLDKREIEAVLAHELTHIRNGDVSMMVICVIIAGIASFLGEMAYRIFLRPNTRFATGMPRVTRPRSSGSSNSKGKGGAAGAIILVIIVAVVIIMIAWLLSGVLRLAISRSREFLADAGAVELTKDPDALISALTRISGKAELTGMPSGIMELCFEHERNGRSDLFSSHPRIADRIKALVDNAGGTMPAPTPPAAALPA
jgi:heat shock protein HtpX